ncbi:hypothetical protein MA16_Dca018884 [Dendrobium catenatum]|uniref:Secreted protein n=1 Tax=Dendrobium catenatum TaxID=906689 RepID=A0A2I0VVZ3_9ASPA|nr:hypothetical protein MA16_Dca018884 [Dendrobium catenatum]
MINFVRTSLVFFVPFAGLLSSLPVRTGKPRVIIKIMRPAASRVDSPLPIAIVLNRSLPPTMDDC